MTSTGQDISDFLLARIAEDEERGHRLVAEWYDVGNACQSCGTGGARVLAECEAKRRIVEANSGSFTLRPGVPVDLSYGTSPGGWMRVRTGGDDVDMTVDEFLATYMEPSPPSINLRLLALPYADHDDYREEWKP